MKPSERVKALWVAPFHKDVNNDHGWPDNYVYAVDPCGFTSIAVLKLNQHPAIAGGIGDITDMKDGEALFDEWSDFFDKLRGDCTDLDEICRRLNEAWGWDGPGMHPCGQCGRQTDNRMRCTTDGCFSNGHTSGVLTTTKSDHVTVIEATPLTEPIVMHSLERLAAPTSRVRPGTALRDVTYRGGDK